MDTKNKFPAEEKKINDERVKQCRYIIIRQFTRDKYFHIPAAFSPAYYYH